MDKRSFIKTISIATLVSPLYVGALNDIIKSIPPKKLEKANNFWLKC